LRPARAAILPALAACAALAALGAASAAAVTLPSGFRDDLVFADLQEPTTLRFSPDGRVFVAEKAGKVLVYDSLADPTPTVFADLRSEVYDNGDRGLLGLALDPGFPARPYVYALYTYDHLLGEAGQAPKWGESDHSGDECPKPESADVDACPVSGRLVRLTAEGDAAAEAGGEIEEDVLVEGWCQQFSSHSIGDLQFDSSGALYVSGGDGASFGAADYGQFGWPQQNQCGDPPGVVGQALFPPAAEGGALRAQDARTPADPTGLDGAVIRIDPATGEGLPDNPMYLSPDPNARRIVAYGFRNPFRFTIDPRRGEIYAGNVGWNTYEEIDRFPTAPATAYNSGWPCYEGPGPTPNYQALGLDLCQGLYADPGAASPPFFVYKHERSVVPEDSCPAADLGSAVSGMSFYEGGPFPAAYDGAFFFADPVRSCIFVMFPGDDGRPDPTTTKLFMMEGGLYAGIDLEAGPEGDLYYPQLFADGEEGSIHRISYDPDAPVARLSADPRWGAAPLEAHLDAGASTDPKGLPLSFKWDLDGNGSFETTDDAEVTKTFSGANNVEVSVRVSDGAKSNVAEVTVYPGDTPPVPQIDEPSAALTWGVGQRIDFSGFAEDAEQGDLANDGLYWKTRLYHCPSLCHAHPLQVFPAVAGGSLLAPDHDYPSHIEISLTATDDRGLAGTTSVSVYPRPVDLAIGSDPPGLELSAGLLSQPAPFVLRVIEDSNVTLAAPATATLAGQTYAWSRWSDGGARVHTVLAGEPASYTAVYAPPPGPSPSPPVAPRSRLLKHPPKRTRASGARFVFGADQADAHFECRLDRAPFKPCRSPRRYRRLAPGRHLVRIRAVGAAGTVERSPLAFAWTVLPKQR
jgi:glucose/arabinose dehydrogenase